MSTTQISIERLTPGTVVFIKTWSWAGMTAPFNDTATVDDIEFDGYGYALTLDGGDQHYDRHYVEAGQSVEFGGRGQSVLRSEKDIPDDELRAKIDALDADIAAMAVKSADIHADTAAMQAEMFGAPALQAAE